MRTGSAALAGLLKELSKEFGLRWKFTQGLASITIMQKTTTTTRTKHIRMKTKGLVHRALVTEMMATTKRLQMDGPDQAAKIIH